jgi:DNA-binding NarL/FixJ family response regulator
MPLRILVADDHTIVRTGLRMLIEREAGLQIVGEAADGHQTVELAAHLQPDVAVVDVGMPLLNGIEASPQIIRQSPRTAIVILSIHSDEAYLLRALRAGARAYLLKDSAEADVVAAIRSVAQGRPFFSPKVRSLLQQEHVRRLQRMGVQDSYESLSPREREVLQLIGEGCTNKEIAALRQLSPHTVETHRAHLLEKLDLHTTADLVLYAVRKGLVIG